MLPTVDFLGTQISRVILGDNPFIGNSYIPDTYPRREMYEYYTAENILKTFYAAEECGINTYLALADTLHIRMYRQYKKEGGKMKIIFQTHPAIDLQAGIHYMMECEPVAIYHQGSTLEEFLEEGKRDYLLSRLELIRSAGVYTGLASHVPEIIMQSERENWGMDFYMTCLYNYRNQRKGQKSSFFTKEQPKYIIFYPEDPPKMYEVIQKVNKPCIAFKIFAGGQVFNNKKQEEIPGVLEDVYTDVFNNIKPNDITCIGVYQKFSNQLKESADAAKKVLGSM